MLYKECAADWDEIHYSRRKKMRNIAAFKQGNYITAEEK